MLPERRARRWDAREAAEAIARIVAGRTWVEYRDEVALRYAVERGFTIVGEALAKLRSTDPAVADRIPDLPRAVGLRNVLIHGYTEIDDETVWNAATTRLAKLVADLGAVLDEQP